VRAPQSLVAEDHQRRSKTTVASTNRERHRQSRIVHVTDNSYLSRLHGQRIVWHSPCPNRVESAEPKRTKAFS
jgi:hypothetical protein